MDTAGATRKWFLADVCPQCDFGVDTLEFVPPLAADVGLALGNGMTAVGDDSPLPRRAMVFCEPLSNEADLDRVVETARQRSWHDVSVLVLAIAPALVGALCATQSRWVNSIDVMRDILAEALAADIAVEAVKLCEEGTALRLALVCRWHRAADPANIAAAPRA